MSEVGSLKSDVDNHPSSLSLQPSALSPQPSALSPLPFQLSTFNFQLSTELSCYLTTALFIVTHNPVLRKQAKAWRQSHPDCSLVIRRFHSIAKQIRC